MALEKEYDRINKEGLCQVMRMYGAGDKLLFINRYQEYYVNSLASIRGKEGESNLFKIIFPMYIRMG